ncbi:MAG: 16S rRNA (cytosine(1402)-N(4))-methyltransferase RsmH [Pacificimonas sp.]|jgi:16S rRNA (cytosine1402-N4)-methyltransferase|nr:16S rRNA (cytosine(1402)-N(4))-methyltransferase RsmH [Pacificimonas sp.]
MSAAAHIPVLLDEVMAAIAPLQGAEVVDGTFGAGGYALRALKDGASTVYGFDRDPAAASCGQALSVDGLEIIEATFSSMVDELRGRGVESVDAVMLDIGVSSMQLDQAERGFSFKEDGPLDMRMSSAGRSAADVVNEADEAELADLIYLYGEERRARQVARALVAARPLSRTSEAAAIIRKAAGQRPGQKTDAATKTFQALRIAVNDELGELERGLAAAEQLLKPGGRLAVVSFHSLEDRIVKRFFRERSGSEPGGSRHLPAQVRQKAPTFEKPRRQIRASERETARNPRARSAILRSAVRTAAAPWPVEGAI